MSSVTAATHKLLITAQGRILKGGADKLKTDLFKQLLLHLKFHVFDLNFFNRRPSFRLSKLRLQHTYASMCRRPTSSIVTGSTSWCQRQWERISITLSQNSTI